MRGLVLVLRKFGAQCYPAAKVLCLTSHAACGVARIPSQELQESWPDLLRDSTQWWDNRQGRRTSPYPDVRHRMSNDPLSIRHPHKPAWVSLQRAALFAGMKTRHAFVCTAVQRQGSTERLGAHAGPLENGMCRKLCENGPISDAVDALISRVQQGCHVDNNLYYLVLKRCIAHRDVDMGIRIHFLTKKSGYEGDAFLATHLISLYASDGRLEEAMQVFTTVTLPTVYNWTTIIFAYARHGEAVQAMRLYRQMLQSTTVRPNNRLYVAVLKACATAGDLVVGKEIHAHILAFSEKSDIFVAAGLISMYVKCGSLDDARIVFDRIPEKDVVVWNAMLAGYAQQGMGQEALSLYSGMQQEGLTRPNSVTYVCLLQACASVGVGAVELGKQLHSQIQEQELQGNLLLGGSLVNMYTKCGSLGNAHRVFDKLPEKTVVIWNAMLAGYTHLGMGQKAFTLYREMRHGGLTPPDTLTYMCLLQACAIVGIGALDEGKNLHAQIEEQGLQGDLSLGGSLVNMYAKCGSLVHARKVFDRLPGRDVVTWNAMLGGYAQQGMGEEALGLFSWMQLEGLTSPNSVTYVCLLQACAIVGVGAVDRGRQLHTEIDGRGLDKDLVLGGSLVNMYAKCGSLGDARRVFDRIPERDVVTWNALLTGYAKQGMGQEALCLYSRMRQEGLTTPNSITYVCLLQACASIGVVAVDQGKQLHAEIGEQGLQEDLILGGSLVNMYAKCGSLGDARRVFDKLGDRDVVTWNALLAGYAQQGMGQEALNLFSQMQQEAGTTPDSVTYVCLLLACASVGIGALVQGKQLHAQIDEQGLQGDMVLAGSLVNMYAKCGSLGNARRILDRLPERDVVTWTSLIAGYTQQGMGQEALSLYNSVQSEGLNPPDSVTYVCLLQACASIGVGALEQGRQLHAEIKEQGLQEDLVIGGSLVNMYAKCGSLRDANRVFDRLPERALVTWNALLAGYAQQGMCKEALCLYRLMQHQCSVSPDSVTYVCLLQACAFAAAFSMGKELHAHIEDRGLQADEVVGAGLVNMYAKCGNMFDAQKVFDSLPERSIDAWNALTSGYARQGDSEFVFELVEKMKLVGIQPDGITFLCLLTACSHVGKVDKGLKLFEAMKEDHCISPTIEHYSCMMDLLGRGGHLEDALRMAKSMPFPPNGVVWRTLLSACRKWKNVEIGEQAFEFAVSKDEKDAASYVLMSNIYASAKMWKEAKEMQTRRKKCGAWKTPGQSWWTDLGGVVHTFVVGTRGIQVS